MDDRTPPRSADVPVLVRVSRNDFLPEFQGQPYDVQLSENAPPGESVFTVIARDRDLQVRGHRSCQMIVFLFLISKHFLVFERAVGPAKNFHFIHREDCKQVLSLNVDA